MSESLAMIPLIQNQSSHLHRRRMPRISSVLWIIYSNIYTRFPSESVNTVKEKAHNKKRQGDVDFPRFSRHASITPTEEKTDARNHHGEENATLQH